MTIASGSLTNDGYFENDGTLTSSMSFDNEGVVINESEIVNNGPFTNASGASYADNVAGFSTVPSMENYSTITNDGPWSEENNGWLDNASGATFTNDPSGLVTISLGLKNEGTFTNSGSVDSTGSFDSTTTLTDSGSITSSGGGGYLSLWGTVNVTSAGSIASNAGSYFTTLGNGITISGSLSIYGDSYVRSITIANGGQFFAERTNGSQYFQIAAGSQLSIDYGATATIVDYGSTSLVTGNVADYGSLWVETSPTRPRSPPISRETARSIPRQWADLRTASRSPAMTATSKARRTWCPGLPTLDSKGRGPGRGGQSDVPRAVQ